MINTPIAVANRIGIEKKGTKQIEFWGMSFITNAHGSISRKCLSREHVIKHRIFKKDSISAKKMWNFTDIDQKS